MAEQKFLNLMIAQVSGPIFEGEVVSVELPGVEGDMTILANHAPLISPLRQGTVTIHKKDDTEETHDITSGTLEISDNHATVLI